MCSELRRSSRMLLSMTGARRTKAGIAAAAWRVMFDFFTGTSPTRTHSLAKRGLTPNDARALVALDRETGKTMGALAQEWECDPANATWVIDRLERLDYAARRPSPTDRRAKLVVLTARGAQVKSKFLAEFYEPPPALLELDASELEVLERLFSTLRITTPSVGAVRNSGRRRRARAASRGRQS